MLKMLFIVIFFCYIVIVTGINMLYTKESYTRNNKTCMTDCNNNICIFGFLRKTEICYPGSTPGLQYYTAKSRTQNRMCISRCGKFDNSPDDWCYVTDDEYDYCNSEMGTKIVKHQTFTASKGPCKEECQHHVHSRNLWCRTYWSYWYFWDTWDYCDTEGFTYMQTKTRQGLDCVGICGAHDEKKYNWCMSTEELESSCAPIARNFTIFNNMSGQVSKLADKDSCHFKADQQNKRPVFYEQNSLPVGFVSRCAKILEYPNMGLLTENVNEDGNPITRYTIMPIAVEGDPALPIVVRARITAKTVRPLNSRRSSNFPLRVRENLLRMGTHVDEEEYMNDEDGHIINYMLGGPGQVYNFAAQTQRLHRDTSSVWYQTEEIIRNFIAVWNGWAEITVVVVYSNISHSWMPDGYAVDLALYNHDNTLYRECNDYYYSNHLKNGNN